jgi:aspartate carbamoyltransferase catalytic subunit
MPAGVEAMGVEAFHDFDAALKGADVVMMLRLQNERMEGQFIPSPREYRHLYGLTAERLALAAPDALVMHPGPMNRGVEIDSDVADLPAAALITRTGRDGRGDPHGLPRRADPQGARGVEGWA